MEKNDQIKKPVLSSLIVYGIVFLIGLAISLSLLIAFSALIAYTPLGEGLAVVGAVIAGAVGIFTSAMLLCRLWSVKGIYSAIIISLSFILIKLIGYKIAFGTFGFTKSSWLSILFIVIFALAGGLFGSNIKK